MTARRGPPSRKVAAWLPVAKADEVRRHAQLAGMTEAAYVAAALAFFQGDRARRGAQLPAAAIMAELVSLRAVVAAAAGSETHGQLNAGVARVEALMLQFADAVHAELAP